MKKIVCAMAMFAGLHASAQLNESFTDGNYTASPVWSGTSRWQVITNSTLSTGVSNSNTLQLDASGAETNYLSTQLQGPWGLSQQWVFWLGRGSQAATDQNRSYVWLYANEANVSSATVDGYRIRFGDDSGDDQIYLERVTNGAAATILTSTGAVTNALTDIGFMVRVTRDAAGVFRLYTSTLPTANGTGATANTDPVPANANVAQGSATDLTYAAFTGGYVAIQAVNSANAAARSSAEFDQLRLTFIEEATLPVKFHQVAATQKHGGVLVSWRNAAETEVASYTVERSNNGTSFTTIGIIDQVKNHNGDVAYQLLDATPLNGVSYYRVKGTERNGKEVYSAIVRMNQGAAATGLLLYPNPVKGTQIGLQLDNLSAGKYTIRVYNSGSQVVASRNFHHAGGSASESFDLSGLKPGVYTLEIAGAVKVQRQFVLQ